MEKKITAREIKKLRDKTGAPVMEVRAALKLGGGDFEKAAEILRQKGKLLAQKKSSRQIGAGLIDAYIHGEGRIGVMLEVGCETDFVARNQVFKSLVHDLALHIAASDPKEKQELLAQPFVRDETITVQELIDQKIALLGENIKVRRFVRYMLGE